MNREESKTLGEKLKRVWVERVEYAGKVPIPIKDEKELESGVEGQELKGMSASEMKSLQENLMKQLE